MGRGKPVFLTNASLDEPRQSFDDDDDRSLVEYSLLLGVTRKDVPPDIGSRQQVLAKYRLPAQG